VNILISKIFLQRLEFILSSSQPFSFNILFSGKRRWRKKTLVSDKGKLWVAGVCDVLVINTMYNPHTEQVIKVVT
jgi:hypothetical protein